MADRYWVGGSGTWNTTSTTNWSASSGGASGASVPTTADNVFFDQAATYTVTMTGALNCLSITVSAGTVTFATGSSPSLTIAGSMSLVAGTVWSSTATLSFTSSVTGRTITTNGTTITGSLSFSGVGGGWTLGSALTTNGIVLITFGTFNTGNYNVTAGQLNSSGSTTRAINLGSSTLTLSASPSSSVPAVNFATNTNLTFNAGTSTIICSGASPGITGGATSGTGVTFYNVSFTSTSAGTSAIVGVNTFNNFAVTGPVSGGPREVTFDSRQTINGTLSTNGTTGPTRVIFRGSTYGIAQTLTINSAASLTDADFRDIYVVGTAAPISGTRVGDLRGCRGITFDTPKTVYWNLAAGGNWSANAWAASSGGAVSANNFPLAQDTAVIENTGLNTSATITFDTNYTNTGTIDMSTRTNAMTLNMNATFTIYGDWKNGSGTTLTNSFVNFSGRKTQTITSAGKSFPDSITVDSFGGSVELADALSAVNTVTVSNGTFNTKNYNVTASGLNSSGVTPRTIILGSSTLTLTNPPSLSASALTFDAGTSQITVTSGSLVTFSGNNRTYYNVTIAGSATSGRTISGTNTFNNLTFSPPASSAIMFVSVAANQTINGTLTVAGASPVQRVFLRSDTLGTPRTLTVATLSATDCDFRDITIAGAAAGSSPTRAGDCGGNSGITFPAAKTVYWNLAGTQNWSATAWCTASGGTPDINQFPLAQDTAVFDDTGSAGTITINAAWNIGTFNASARTSAMTFSTSTLIPLIYGDWFWGTGVTSSTTTGALTFAKRGTQTITSNGVTFNCPIVVDSFSGTVQLADALTLPNSRALTVLNGTFDAVTYNVTIGFFALTGSNIILKMGSGTWTLGGFSNVTPVWSIGTVSNFALYKGSADIVLSDATTGSRTFAGGGLSYNKLTIGGTVGTSTLTITGNNQFTELASTKTVAHTIALGSTTQTFGAWTVTGTAGNVVTLTGTGTGHVIAGARVTGIDYLAMGSIGFSSTSPGEFYAGANSTGTAGAPVFRTAAPAPTTRYWRGGTGTWDATTTTNWSTSSGGSGGASVPTSADAVVFDSASNATAYTVTCTATQLRCGTLTISGPASGNVTWAGTAPLACHDSVTLPATGLTRTYTGELTLTGSSTSRTFTTNGITFGNSVVVNGIGCGWVLGSSLSLPGWTLRFTNGTLDTVGYAVSASSLSINSENAVTLTLGATSFSLTNSTPIFATPNRFAKNFTFNAGTSTFIWTGGAQSGFNVGAANGFTSPLTFNNLDIGTSLVTGGSGGTFFGGNTTFNNLRFYGRSNAGISEIILQANITVTGTLTVVAGTDATCREFIRSDTLGTTRTITATAVSLTDADFRDITIAGAAAPASGTRLGDCKGNSGITFDAAKTVYWNLAGSNNWSATAWATSLGGTPAVNNFPLAQDTAVFGSASPGTGTTTTINASYNIGTIDMSARTANTMTLATGTNLTIYGNWINGTGTTISGATTLTFAGRGSQTITSAGKTFTQAFTINSPGGSVTLQDSFIASISSNSAFTISAGTFDAATYNVTFSGAGAQVVSNSVTTARTIAVGSGTWTLAGSGFPWDMRNFTGLTVTGTGTISLTNASAKTFAGGGLAYTNITVNQGGAGSLTISGNNTFKDITNTYSNTGATTIALSSTVQTVSQFTATGASGGRTLSITGASSSTPGSLVLTGATKPNVDYLTVSNVRAYSLDTTWYAGRNSTNNGSLGWYFDAESTTFASVVLETATSTDTIVARLSLPALIIETGTATDSIEADKTGGASDVVLESATGSDVVYAYIIFGASISETATITDLASARAVFIANINETGSAADAIEAFRGYLAEVSEFASAVDTVSTTYTANPVVAETATGSDTVAARSVINVATADTATITDLVSGGLRYLSSVAETATAADVISAARTVAGAITEAATASDTASARAVFRAAIAEASTATDIIFAFAQFRAALSDTATGTDTVIVSNSVNQSISETATGTDTAAVQALLAAQIAELSTGTDSSSVAPSIFNAPVAETATATDNFNARAVFYASVTTTVTIGDTVVGRFLWELIDDTQTANWQNIPNTQAGNWQTIPNTQTSGWTIIPTLP